MTEFSDQDRTAICDVFERLLTSDADEAALRRTLATDIGFDPNLWKQMSALGLTGIMIGEAQGGVGGTIEDAEALMEVAGAHLLASPFLPSCIIAPVFLQASDDVGLCGPVLDGIVSGNIIVTIAGSGPDGDWTKSPSVVATATGDGWQLNGEAGHVLHVPAATHALVIATVSETRAAFWVDLSERSITATHHATDDRTVRLSTLVFNHVSAQKLSGVGETDIAHAFKIAIAGLAGEQAGASRRIFDITLEYLNTRFQFGQPIGRFQALKHMAADLLVEVESASTVARMAARALAANAPDADTLVYLAGFTCADNYKRVAADAIQLHGGIAYTMEHPAHLYWRRAQTGQWLLASSDTLRELYLREQEALL